MEEKSIRGKGAISRRGFLGLAGIAGAAVIGGAAVTGCSPSAGSKIESDTTTAGAQAGSTVDPIPAVEAPSSWTKEADVVVCGSGGGLVAAVRSAELGNKVILIEKADSWGGSSKETDIFSVMGSTTQQKLYEAYADKLIAAGDPRGEQLKAMSQAPAEAMRKQWMAKFLPKPGNGNDTGPLPDGTTGIQVIAGDAPVMASVCDGICNAVDWLGEYVGVPWDVVHEMGSAGMLAGICPQGSEAGGFVARANYSVFEMLFAKAEALGIEILMQTPLEAFVKDEDAVVGVKASDANGELFIKANKGVVLATGSMIQNKAMLERYVPSVGYRALTAAGSMNDTGEGILAAWGAGADMQGYDSSFCFDGGVESDGWAHYLYKGDVQLARQPWLGINVQGERYPYYPVDTLGFTHQSGILMSQPRNRGYVIFDANYEDTIWNWEATGANQMICRRPMWPEGEGEKTWNTNGNYERLPEFLCEHDWRIGVQQGLDAGYIHECQTLDELAEKINMSADKLKKAVENWNAICAAGVDEQWHFDPAWLVPIKDAPYYCMAIGSTVLATNCGVPITPECQAIGTDGNPIKGLYAVGSAVGGLAGDSTYGDCRNPGGGVGLTCGTAFVAANAIG